MQNINGENEMSTVIDKLNETILKQYNVSITAEITIFKDNYESQEGEYSNSYIEITKGILTDAENLSYDLINLTQNYITDVLDMEYNDGMIEESLTNSFGLCKFWLCTQVNEDNKNPTENQIIMWEEAHELLFIKDMCVRIKINDTRVSNDLLFDLMFKDQLK